MASDIDICNSALDILGVENIASFSEDSKAAFLCQKNYPRVRDEFLGSHYWNFAMIRASFTALPDAPTFGFSKAFQLPADCIRVRQLEDPGVKFKVEGRTLITDVSEALVEYISSGILPGNFSPMFAEALAYQLASKLAYPLIQSVSLSEQLERKAQLKLRDARSFDGQEGWQDDLVTDEFLDARRVSVTGEPRVKV